MRRRYRHHVLLFWIPRFKIDTRKYVENGMTGWAPLCAHAYTIARGQYLGAATDSFPPFLQNVLTDLP